MKVKCKGKMYHDLSILQICVKLVKSQHIMLWNNFSMYLSLFNMHHPEVNYHRIYPEFMFYLYILDPIQILHTVNKTNLH
jgi:hypothetical protein